MSKNIYKYNDEQQKLLDDLQKYIDEHGVPKAKDFRLKNGLRSFNYYKKTFNKTHLKDILALAGVKTSEKYNIMHYSINKNLNDDDLLEILKEYSNKFGFPTQRQFKSKNGLPSYTTYVKRFGSFKDAIILAGIEIPDDRKWLFERKEWSEEDAMSEVKKYVDDVLEKGGNLPSYSEIEKQKNLPSETAIVRLFGNLSNLYKNIGYDEDYNVKMLKDKLLEDYIKLGDYLNRTPTSRDLDKYSTLGVCCSASTYVHNFGSMYEIQLISGYTPVNIGRNKNREDMIDDLLNLYEEIGRLPCQRDIHQNPNIASVKKYADEFGSFTEALKVAGFKDVGNNKVIMSPNGNACFSSYEYDFCCMLENNNIDFEKDEYYKKYITDLERNYQFDFTIFHKGEVFFIEIFGMYDRDDYSKIADTKKGICIDNNINLIDLYPRDFKNKKEDDLYEMLMQIIK